ncbi:MAG: hypothetical protein HY744_05470 [Deltaproteobacteria bacterium]|nr:hypothetical protein [Deltaproteobacteria bacterium]
MVRALRAELAPVECADAVVQPLLADLPAAIDPALQHALAGLGLAGRLARTVLDGPRLDPPFERARVEELIAGPLHAWFAEQAAAIEDIARAGAKLAYYGRAIVAVEAGMADMRFIDAARAAPIPDEIAGDQELRDAYYGGLEMGLEARKRRGRDAALVGLGQLAYLGVIRDERAERARQLLSRMYGGRPVGALDALLLPPLAPAEPATVPERLAARLPTFYAGLLIAPERAAEPTMLRMLVEKGISPPQRAALRAAALPPAVRALYARARLELGQRYWRRVDFDEAAGLLRELPAAERTPEARLVLALSIALRGGPANAADMMLRAPLAELGIGRVAALDALAAETGGPLRPLAAFDAALVLDIAAPKDAGTGYWLALARRYRDAAAWLPEGAERAQAVERAREAEGTAKAIAPRGAAPEQ